MQRSIQEHLEAPTRRKMRKTRNGLDEINAGRAKTGDVIYLPSQPEHRLTVTQASTFQRSKIEVTWFDSAGELRREEISARGFVTD